MRKLNVVLDTNVFIVSLIPHMKYYWVYENLLDGKYNLPISNEILTEYQEQLAARYDISFVDSNLDFLLLLPNVKLVEPSFRWNFIKDDADDNKFVDCAVASNADYIITHDRHFRVLEQIEFPKVKTAKLDAFKTLLL
jgi:putative PIN family toxin of toxin-antitoxin system